MARSGSLQLHNCSASYVGGPQDVVEYVCLHVIATVNACDPQNFEPNLALNLEIADLINAKKGSA
jgi:hypothetical protein